MATITITKLRCVRQQDVTGEDEPVIYLGGQFAWEGKMDKSDWDYPNESRTFGPSILVQLKEKNRHNSYKTLGSWTINDVAATNKKLTASSSGYHYELYYSVELAPTPPAACRPDRLIEPRWMTWSEPVDWAGSGPRPARGDKHLPTPANVSPDRPVSCHRRERLRPGFHRPRGCSTGPWPRHDAHRGAVEQEGTRTWGLEVSARTRVRIARRATSGIAGSLALPNVSARSSFGRHPGCGHWVANSDTKPPGVIECVGTLVWGRSPSVGRSARGWWCSGCGVRVTCVRALRAR